MGANNPNFPNSVLNDDEAIAYLGAQLAAVRAPAYTALTGASPTLTAAQMVNGTVELSGQTTAQTVTTDTAANIIAQMQTVDPNAAVGSVYPFHLVNDNTGTGAATLTAGANVTVTTLGTNNVVPINQKNSYQLVWATATTVTIRRA